MIGLPLVQAIAHLPRGGRLPNQRDRDGTGTLSTPCGRSGILPNLSFPAPRRLWRLTMRRSVGRGDRQGPSRLGSGPGPSWHSGTHFVVLKTADDGPGKPRPDILMAAMSETGVSPVDTAMIGDTVFDMRNGGIGPGGSNRRRLGLSRRLELMEAGADDGDRRFRRLAGRSDHAVGP